MKIITLLSAILILWPQVVLGATDESYEAYEENQRKKEDEELPKINLYDKEKFISESGRNLWGNGNNNCDENLPQLSVGKENMINTKADWDAFAKANTFFVLGATGSTCEDCCTTEPILNDLQ